MWPRVLGPSDLVSSLPGAPTADPFFVVLIEDEHSIPGDDEHFADSVHFEDPGSRRMADRVLAVLADSPALGALVARKQDAGEDG